MYTYEAPVFLHDENTFVPKIIGHKGGNVELVNSDAKPATKHPILWELDLGLFNTLKAPLSDKSQFDRLEARLRQFCETMIQEWEAETLGIHLFQGTLEDILSFPWDEVQHQNYTSWLLQIKGKHCLTDADLRKHYACTVLNDFLGLLTSGIPEQTEWFVSLDVSELSDLNQFYLLSNPARFEHLHIFWKCPSHLFLSDLVWSTGTPLRGFKADLSLEITPPERFSSAWCLPLAWNLDEQSIEYCKSIQWILDQNEILARPIAEEKISLEWQGLDTIFVDGTLISDKGRRQLAGFCAAGGQVVSVGKPLELTNEVRLDDYLRNYAQT